MKYITPLYEKTDYTSKDVVCASLNFSIYEEDGEVVQEIDFSFSSIIKN